MAQPASNGGTPKQGFDPRGRPLTIAAARAEIERICGERGVISEWEEVELAKTIPKFQEEQRRKAQQYRDVYARYTKTVAEQLYSSRFRLIYELLQNADDSQYDKNVQPSVTFRIQPTQLVIESNEIGFSLNDVNSICSTGKSSKINDTTTTGEKGLGFKSVFGIADRVSVQSGLWSFRFEHKKGEDGVGMVTPIWTDAASSLPSNIGTRLTLRYSDSSSKFLSLLISEFEKLPKTITFALRQLTKVVVAIESSDAPANRITFSRIGSLTADKMRLETTVVGHFGDHKSESTYLRLSRSTVSGLPADSHRKMQKSTVTLAFEVDDTGSPVTPVRGQHAFAYLPVQRIAQLPFLINADFVLAANRESVPDTEWNQALRPGIIAAFIHFVMNVVTTKADALAFKWMRLLPGKAIEGYWDGIYGDIRYTLTCREVFYSHRGRLYDISHVKSLPMWFFYDNQPLVPDLDQDIYLSDDYQHHDIATLKELGLQEISPTQIVARIKPVVSEETPSSARGRGLEDQWHTAFTGFIHQLLRVPTARPEILKLDLIPLSDNSWVSPVSLTSATVYLPGLVKEGSVNIDVPDGLDLKKLHPTAAGVEERAAFYKNLGVISCPEKTVVQRILQAHKDKCDRGNTAAYVQDTEALFWFGMSSSVPAIQHGDLLFRSSIDRTQTGRYLFFPSQKPYDAEQLLATDTTSSAPLILNKKYEDSQINHHTRHKISWTDFLEKCGVAHIVPLAMRSPQGVGLHPLMRRVARDNSKNFVANLREHWAIYRKHAPIISEELRTIKVPCRHKTIQQLGETVLPTHQLVAKSSELQMEILIPFLELPGAYTSHDPDTWLFLEGLGVICEANSDFYLKAVRLWSAADKLPTSLVSAGIYAGIAQTTAAGEATATLQQIFSQEWLICTRPSVNARNTRAGCASWIDAWCKSSDCIWDGPKYLRSKKVLKPIYGGDANAAHFFKIILQIRDVKYEDLVDDLCTLASNGDKLSPKEEDDVTLIYTMLSTMVTFGQPAEVIRHKFEAHGLIYAHGKWLKPSECLWNCAVRIAGREPLDHVFPKLKHFFVDKLEVTTMNINVLLQELTRAAQAQGPDFEGVKRIMLAAGQLIASDSSLVIDANHLKALNTAAFCPVRSSAGILLSKNYEDFFINDHRRYDEAFKGKIRLLDFGHEEMTSLHPFFEKLQLRDKYLSSRVLTKTTVDKSTINDDLTQYFQDRAYAFSCCANKHKSPEYFNKKTTMHQLLLKADVYTCESMWTELQVTQDDKPVCVRSDRAMVKITQDTSTLKLYVPNDRDGLYSCFHTELPGQLAQLLGIQEGNAAKIIYRILNDNEKDLDTIMHDEDLSGCTWFEKPVMSQNRSAFPMLSEDKPRTIDQDRGVRDAPDVALLVRQTGTDISGPPKPDAGDTKSPVSVSIKAEPQKPVWETVARDAQYKKLLNEVIRQARHYGSAANGSFSMAAVGEALNNIDNTVDYVAFHRTFAGLARGSFEESAPIGAAGELFVFEFLKASGVSNFTIENWQSSIRNSVYVLPEYVNEKPWYGPEISDIMYEGLCPRLMAVVRDNTSFPLPPWFDSATTSGSTKFYVEVKTTTGPCGTDFTMSSYQYQLMREKACDPQSTTPPKEVLIIMRVFNLFSSKIGLQIYVNPWHLRDTALEFVADSWKVVPQTGKQGA